MIIEHIEPRTEQETALIAVHVQRAADLRQQMDLLMLRSMLRDAQKENA